MVSSIPIQESSPIANVGNGREGGDEKDMVTSVVAGSILWLGLGSGWVGRTLFEWRRGEWLGR